MFLTKSTRATDWVRVRSWFINHKSYSLTLLLKFEHMQCFLVSAAMFPTWSTIKPPCLIIPACRRHAASLAPRRALCGWLRATDRRDSHADVQQPPLQVLPCAAAGLCALVPSSLHSHPHCGQQGKGQQAQWVTSESQVGCMCTQSCSHGFRHYLHFTCTAELNAQKNSHFPPKFC